MTEGRSRVRYLIKAMVSMKMQSVFFGKAPQELSSFHSK